MRARKAARTFVGFHHTERTLMRHPTRALIGGLLIAATSTVAAQTIVAEGPVVYGHHHLNTTDMAAQKRFYVETLGGTLATIGTNDLEVVEFPNVFLFFRPMQQPTGGTIGSTVNHIGFSVPDLKPIVARIKAAGFKMITSDSVAATVKVTEDIAAASPTTNIAFVLGPEDVKIELVEVKTQQVPIQLHHVHFFGEHNAEMQAWYAKTFGAAAQPATGQAFLTAQLPGVNLSFSPSQTPTVATQGRALDHIGFEVKNLEAFTKKLEAEGIPLTVSYRTVPALDIAIAFIKDPWGTNIELTEGLADID
jgi:catechol 2,3-dioxygenase-like lactoylglutathione lyase family enzyme